MSGSNDRSADNARIYLLLDNPESIASLLNVRQGEALGTSFVFLDFFFPEMFPGPDLKFFFFFS